MPEPTKPLLGQFLPAMRAVKGISYARKLIPPVLKKGHKMLSDSLSGRNQSAGAAVIKTEVGAGMELKKENKKK